MDKRKTTFNDEVLIIPPYCLVTFILIHFIFQSYNLSQLSSLKLFPSQYMEGSESFFQLLNIRTVEFRNTFLLLPTMYFLIYVYIHSCAHYEM